MPIGLDWDDRGRVWTFRTGATFDLAEIARLVQRTDWKDAEAFLWDMRGLVQGPDTSPEIRETAAMVRRRPDPWSGSRVAILVDRDLDYGIARMFKAYADGVDIRYRIFRDESDARAWLSGSDEA